MSHNASPANFRTEISRRSRRLLEFAIIIYTVRLKLGLTP
ncbi:Uncharacterised protein [Mycobacteroides abscessus subsp. abscessus]|nr:Uncharacterised protein [Mycobacteroides abscessus subsp. abscessus]